MLWYCSNYKSYQQLYIYIYIYIYMCVCVCYWTRIVKCKCGRFRWEYISVHISRSVHVAKHYNTFSLYIHEFIYNSTPHQGTKYAFIIACYDHGFTIKRKFSQQKLIQSFSSKFFGSIQRISYCRPQCIFSQFLFKDLNIYNIWMVRWSFFMRTLEI